MRVLASETGKEALGAFAPAGLGQLVDEEREKGQSLPRWTSVVGGLELLLGPKLALVAAGTGSGIASGSPEEQLVPRCRNRWWRRRSVEQLATAVETGVAVT